MPPTSIISLDYLSGHLSLSSLLYLLEFFDYTSPVFYEYCRLLATSANLIEESSDLFSD